MLGILPTALIRPALLTPGTERPVPIDRPSCKRLWFGSCGPSCIMLLPYTVDAHVCSLLLASSIFTALAFVCSHCPTFTRHCVASVSWAERGWLAVEKAPPMVNGIMVLRFRVRRAGHAYQKMTMRCYMLQGATLSSGKWDSTPRDVALSVFCLALSCSSLTDNSHRFTPDKEPWPAYTACELVVARTSVSSSADGQHGTFSFPDFPVRMDGSV